jgi:hypothetical protein
MCGQRAKWLHIEESATLPAVVLTSGEGRQLPVSRLAPLSSDQGDLPGSPRQGGASHFFWRFGVGGYSVRPPEKS